MGMDLSGVGGSFRFNMEGWSQVLCLAHAYGWQPKGTQLDYDFVLLRCDNDELLAKKIMSEWKGSYSYNEYQTVTAEDAAGIAGALEKALPDIPNHDALTHKTVHHLSANGELHGGIPCDIPVNPFEWFSGPESKQHVVDFIKFCRAGEFCIG
ncbi:MAG: hypothetical protein QUV05_18400 [Phycisphaerae bacterium]|nr:hypothetical protein [Phycisphaerae bacterium]